MTGAHLTCTDGLVGSLFRLCREHGAGELELRFVEGRLGIIEALFTFEWRGKRYERSAMIDYEGLPALEQLEHLALCVFEPDHRAAYGELVRERRNVLAG